MRRTIHTVSRVLAVGSAAGVVLLIALISADVLLRELGIFRIVGAAEISEMTMPMIAYLAFAFAFMRGAHVSTTLVTDRVPEAVSRVLITIGLFVLLAFLIWLTYATIEPAIHAYQIGQVRYGLLELPTWPARAAISIGLIAMCLEAVLRLVDSIRGTEEAQLANPEEVF